MRMSATGNEQQTAIVDSAIKGISHIATLPEIRGYLDLLGIEALEEPIDQGWRRVRVR